MKQMRSNQLYCDDAILCRLGTDMLSGSVVLMTVQRSCTIHA